MTVAPTAASALAKDEVCAVVLRHIVNDLVGFGVLEKCSGGDDKDAILTRCAVKLLAAAVCAVLSLKLAGVAVIEKGVDVGVNADDHVTSVTSVASVGTAVVYVFFTSEGNGTVTAVAGSDMDCYSVYKHLCTSVVRLIVIVALFADDELDGSALEAEGIAQAVFDVSLI